MLPELTPKIVRDKLSILQSNIDALTTMAKKLNEQIKSREAELNNTTASAQQVKSKLMQLFFTDPDQLSGPEFH